MLALRDPLDPRVRLAALDAVMNISCDIDEVIAGVIPMIADAESRLAKSRTKSVAALLEIGPASVGALAVTILPPLLPQLIGYLLNWSKRADNRKVKIKTQVGDRSLEFEFSPEAMSKDELNNLVNTLTASLK